MRPKNYIALLLALLFLGKLVGVDARGYSLLLESKGISLVNHFCEKGNLTQAEDAPDFQEDSRQLSLEMDFLCQAPVQLTTAEWELLPVLNNFRTHFYLDPGLPQVHDDRFYPPPRA